MRLNDIGHNSDHAQNIIRIKNSIMMGHFLECFAPLVFKDIIRNFSEIPGIKDVTIHGETLNTYLSFSMMRRLADDMPFRFNFRNVLLELVSIDRDADPLEFDTKLRDPNYFMNKLTRIMNGRIIIIQIVRDCDDFTKLADKISNTWPFDSIKIMQRNANCNISIDKCDYATECLVLKFKDKLYNES